ncbi:unnamed protein product [Sphagnum jensenii]|uniref:GRPD C-terminal domain-containing protein n=1 Tax=Sphagnum jensenii TaxID=128206 RepID=A0ABP0VPQ2_9BRYO
MANLGEAVSPPPPPPAAAAPHHHPSHAAAGSVEKQRRQQQEGQQQQQKSSSTSSSSNSYLEELKCAQRVSISVDLVLAAKRELGFLRTIESLPFLHGGPAIYRAIRRYQEFWMPLAQQLDLLLLPPLDVQWVWHCHCLNPVGYRDYCIKKYGRVINVPLLADLGSEMEAQERCKKLWTLHYPKEPFDIMDTLSKLPPTLATSTAKVYPIDEFNAVDHGILELEELVGTVARQSSFYYQVSQPYMWEDSFLQVAKERYKCFLHMLSRLKGSSLCVPTFDIDLMWHAHQLSPIAYTKDTKALLGCIVDHDDTMERGPNTKLGHGFEDTIKLWESTFGTSYERAGSMYRGSKPVNLPAPRPPAPSESSSDSNYKALENMTIPVCIMMKVANAVAVGKESGKDLFVRLKVLEAHKLLKLESCISLNNSGANLAQWEKLWLLQCEMRTKGVVIELRQSVEGCLQPLSKIKRTAGLKLTWQELLKTPMLSLDTAFSVKDKRFMNTNHLKQSSLQLHIGASITPPVQGAYLFKAVPDRVTDDKGRMLSNIMLRLNKYEPQIGRWISQTVLNHSGRECFVIRIRAAKGIWTKGGERPVGVDWNERIINVHEGGWTYVAKSIGTAPDKIAGSATPFAGELGQYKLSWALSTGETLIISRRMHDLDWERHLDFSLKVPGPGLACLINGRKLQYEVPGATSEDEEGFVTLIRYTQQTPQGKATALFNFKVTAMEVLPEESVLLVLLLCTATLRSIADFGGVTSGHIDKHRRVKENAPGLKDWGSVVLENANSQSDLAFWYYNVPDPASNEDEDGVGFSGPMGGACGSLARANTSEVQTNTPISAAVIDATAGEWGRRTGSGIPVNNPIRKT